MRGGGWIPAALPTSGLGEPPHGVAQASCEVWGLEYVGAVTRLAVKQRYFGFLYLLAQHQPLQFTSVRNFGD